jgi:hypothetical protein
MTRDAAALYELGCALTVAAWWGWARIALGVR